MSLCRRDHTARIDWVIRAICVQTNQEHAMTFTTLERDFRSPGNEYRGQPFWAWNGDLQPDELRRQIRLMRRMGLGGFFMHSRVGLATPYLADEWFRCIEACADEAEKLGMIAWLYDEDRWPSGAAGGLVTQDPRWRKRSLMMDELSSPAQLKWSDDVVAAFTARVDGPIATNVTPVARGARPRRLADGECLLVFRAQLDAPNSWYNGATYLDVLNPLAVRRFIKVTHEAYRKRLGRHLGKTIPGIFTDEPNHGQKLGFDNNTGALLGLPWTGALPAVFRKRYGYDLIPRLPELFLDVDGRSVTPARRDYHDCVTHLFVDAFARQIGEWCETNGLIHIGHVLLEDTLSSQADVVGSCMRFYEHMQAPSMDLLTEHWRAYTTAKQVSSAARQFGRRWRLTETYGCTGWDFPFAGHKALGDWQVALGINLRCQHLAWYTMEGEAKRDYPAAIFYQSPWWELYAKVEDYYARIHAVMTRGTEVRDLLVIHPVESAWTMIRRGWQAAPQVRDFDQALIDLEDALLGAHLDFDYGDEDILARHGSTVRRKGQPVLRVGQADYAAVIVPSAITLRATTLDLLGRFRALGGLVVFAGQPAAYVDALPNGSAAAFAAACVATPGAGEAPEAVIQAVEAAARRVSIADADGREIAAALYLLREDRDAFYLFACNTGDDNTSVKRDWNDRPRAVERTQAFPSVVIRGFAACAGQPLELDPETGAVYQADALRADDGNWVIRTSFAPLGSRLFVIPKRTGGQARPPRPALTEMRAATLDPASWRIIRSEHNVLALDRPRRRVGGGDWQAAEEILRVDRAVRAGLGLAPRGGAMVQPWARQRAAQPKHTAVELAYEFVAQAAPAGGLWLAIEQPQRFAIALNGQPVCADVEDGWWTDPSMRKVPLDPALIRPGPNELRLSLDYDEDYAGLEIVYLLGEFGVTLEGDTVALTEAPAALSLGDWCAQGLPFYSGAVAYRARIRPDLAPGERLIARVPDYRGAAVRVLVDGRPAGVIGWEPNEVDITSLLAPDGGEVELAIEVFSHRRNSHGPLHHAKRWPMWTGPGEYVTSGDDWTDGYTLVPCGLMKPVQLVVARAPSPPVARAPSPRVENSAD
jgi:hypothetical protein